MVKLTQDTIEKEFLSVLVLEPKIGFDLLQIKPKYLEIPINRKIFEVVLKAKDKFEEVTTSGILSIEPGLVDSITDVITVENIPPLNKRRQFMIAQKTILDNYKKKVIRDLTIKMNRNEISCDEYLEKMSKINAVVIDDKSDELTEGEILNNINSENVRIKLKKYPLLDETLKLVQGDFLIIGASTGVGKSGLLLNIMNELMNDYQCIYFNMEMSKPTIYKRMLAIKSGLRVIEVENPKAEWQKALRDSAIKKIIDNKVVVEHKANYLGEIRSVLGTHKDDTKHTIIFLDHVGLIKSDSKKTIYEQTTEVAKQLRQFCLDYNCTIISACQLNRTSYTTDEKNLSMLKDSGELENSASKVILLYKNKNKQSIETPGNYTDYMVADIVKNRDGIVGQVKLTYDKSKQIFTEGYKDD